MPRQQPDTDDSTERQGWTAVSQNGETVYEAPDGTPVTDTDYVAAQVSGQGGG